MGVLLAKVNMVADSPLTIDMPYGPNYSNLFHRLSVNVCYADGHAKFVRVSDRELPIGKGNWFDQAHQADGQ